MYNAMGLAAYELFDNVDFDQWFKNQLLGELQVNHYRYSHTGMMILFLIVWRFIFLLTSFSIFQNTTSEVQECTKLLSTR